jgi:hypothetical protein
MLIILKLFKMGKWIFKNIIIGAFLLFVSIGFSQSTEEISESNSPFEVKGFHLDLRIQVMKLEALKELAEELSNFGINTMIMEWEGTFPFESHLLIPNKLSYTKKEIKEFIAFCDSLSIDVIPLQQSLGHMEYILRHSRYAEQREDQKDVSQLCPVENDLNRALLTDLFTEMAESHYSKYFHIGGDEAYLFGHCNKCQLRIKENSKSGLFVEHLLMVCDILKSLGKIPIIWSDIANKYPEELHRLPKETIFIVWNYGWALDRFGDPEKLTELGFEVWGAASLRSNPDNFYLTHWEKHINNFRDFIPISKKSGYKGMIVTSWSTSGVYSTVIEDKQTISQLIPVRNVYPLNGFRLLISAFSEAVHSSSPLNVDQFIATYGNQRFGFDKKQSQVLWHALISGSANQVINNRVEDDPKLSVKMLLDISRKNQKELYSLKPSTNEVEFEHFRLMSDIRENYLSFKYLESRANSDKLSAESLSEFTDGLETILNKENSIEKRFIDAHETYLYFDEIKQENWIRKKRVQLLYDRLIKMR